MGVWLGCWVGNRIYRLSITINTPSHLFGVMLLEQVWCCVDGELATLSVPLLMPNPSLKEIA